ncbi:sortase domain-containing protein [Sporichthya polymorpha]|uniref:sortase domain-containing protein n=1 Tax=Sporichthya polymorpha TaxID=35751 RepID=UPI00037A13B8|nr:sortase [Sporichthya polymorpha]
MTTDPLTRSTSAAHRSRRWAAAAACVALLGGCGGGGEGPAVAGVSLPAPTPAAAAGTAPAAAEDRPYPARVRLPRLGIDAVLQPLHLGKQKELVPPEYGMAGWYEAGPEPGEIGRAVVAGHVDSRTGPDVFAALGKARPGDRIHVLLRDRSTVTFVVQKVEIHPRNRFPTSRVYGTDGKHADLRLITCTGRYDRARGGYQDNVVVFARMAPGKA